MRRSHVLRSLLHHLKMLRHRGNSWVGYHIIIRSRTLYNTIQVKFIIDLYPYL